MADPMDAANEAYATAENDPEGVWGPPPPIAQAPAADKTTGGAFSPNAQTGNPPSAGQAGAFSAAPAAPASGFFGNLLSGIGDTMTSLAPQVVRAVAGGVDGRFNNQATALPSYTPAPPPFNWKPLAAIAAALVLLAILIRNKE